MFNFLIYHSFVVVSVLHFSCLASLMLGSFDNVTVSPDVTCSYDITASLAVITCPSDDIESVERIHLYEY